MKRRLLLFSTFIFVLATSTIFAQGQGAQPIVNAGYLAIDGAHATIHVVRHADGSVTGGGQWIYPDKASNLYIDVDQVEISADGTEAYLSGHAFLGKDKTPLGPRYVLKLIDTGEGSNASGPDMEAYVIPSNDPGWDLSNPFARFLLDTPAVYGFAHWFEIQAGNIQVHSGN